MKYKTVTTIGVLAKISLPTLVERVTNPDLIFPGEIYCTKITIEPINEAKEGPSDLEVFGVIPENYLGKSVKFFQFYDVRKDGCWYLQEFYVEGKQIFKVSVIKNK